MSRLHRARSALPAGLGYLVFLILFALPVYWILLSSVLPSGQLLSDPPTYFTTDPTLDNVRRTLDQVPLTTYLRNSTVFAVGSSLVTVALSYAAAYAFARIRFRGANVLLMVFLLTMALPQIATVIPLFRTFQQLGLVDTMTGLILVQSSMLVPFTVWTLTSFVKQVPVELEEAAVLDGANFWQRQWLVMAPLLAPAFATMFIVNFITTWNELFHPLVFATSTATRPLTIGLVQLTQATSGMATRPWDLMSTLSAVMIIPIILVVVFAQRRIVSGLTAGAGK